MAACGGGSGGSGGSGGATSSTTSTGSGIDLSTCDSVDNGVGCCDDSGVLHYCSIDESSPSTKMCPTGTACGWNTVHGYYDCVTGNAGPDPGGMYPMTCGASGTGSSTTSSTSTGGGPVTWTQLYTTIFGPGGSSSCVANGGCHTFSQSGFKCGTSKSTCYTGMVNAGLVTPGADAQSSVLAKPQQSPLCGSLGGAMPKGGKCVTTAQVDEIKSWLAAGAQND